MGPDPSLGQVAAALAEVSAQPGETVGRVRLSVPRAAVPFVIDPVLPKFRDTSSADRGRGRHRRPLRRHRRGGIRRRGPLERGHRARHGAGAPDRRLSVRRRGLARLPRAPRDARAARGISCATSASRSARKRRARSTPGSWSAGAETGACPFAGASSAATPGLNASLAEQGLGLVYALEPMVIEQLRAGG